MNQWSLFKRSWSIFWKNKTLWVFGLLAALSGGAANFNFNFRSVDVAQLANLPIGGREMLQQLFGSIDINSWIAAGAVVVMVLFVISTFARAGLYRMINAVDENQPLSLGAGFRAAGEKFLPLLAVRLILALPTIILGVIAAGSFAAMFSELLKGSGESTPVFDLSALGSFAGLSAVVLVLSLLTGATSISAERAVVLDGLSIFGSIARGWKYIWKKFEDYFTIGLIWILLAIGLGLLFVCALAPFLLASLGAFIGGLRPGVNVTTFSLNLAGPALIAAAIIGLLFGTFINVFEASVWTLAYRVWRVS